MSTAFDTLSYVEKLTAAGEKPEIAKAHAEALRSFDQNFSGNAATKKDIHALSIEMDLKLANLKAEILKWLFALLFGQAAFIVTLIKITG